MREVPVIPIEHVSKAELKAYAFADNKIASNVGWDEETLKIEFAELSARDTGFDLEVTGFSTTEIDRGDERAHFRPDRDPRSRQLGRDPT
ncbi:hypothetical protein [Sphingomonas oleivorans]|nr:hypothetical protein [Sphingomonas oleivorans]